MLPGKKYSIDDIVRIALRRKWFIILPAVLGFGASVVVARHMPQLYRSETLIMVIPQRIPDSIVKSTVTAKLEERLPSISDQILSRSRLERVISDFNLYPVERAKGVMEDVIQRMRTDIKGPSLVGKESFRLSYVSSDAKTAQRVTERLASLYIEENLRDRENLATGTNQFLESQLAEAKQRLIEYEKRLEEYRKQYAGQLPSQLQTNLQAIQNAQLQLQAVSESINRARERRLLIERQLADAQVLPATVVSADSGAGAAGNAPPSTAQQLQSVQARLDAFKLQYTADHPDVRALERTVRDLQARLEEENRHPAAAVPVTPAEAARQKRVRDLKAELDVVDRQIAVNQAEEASLKKSIAGYQSKVDAVPTRESELVELTRDYATVQASYNSLLAKQQDSKLAANLETRQVGEQFKILDPASLPEKPYNHMLRLQIMLGGFLGGLLLGAGFVGLLEQRDSSFKTEEDVIRVLTLPVLALVPVLAPEPAGAQTTRRRRRFLGLLVALVAIGSAAAVAIWRLQP